MFKIARASLTVLAAYSLVVQAAPPAGWLMAGSKPADYDSGVDAQTAYNNKPSGYLKSKKAAIEGFGTLMQNFKADQYIGMRVRFSAYVKSESVEDWAGLWMRVDGGPNKVLSFDNMQDRPIKGTTGWQNYQVVLDVPTGATSVNFGILLSGTGTVWLNSANFEIVPSSTPLTGAPLPGTQSGDRPQNLDF